MKRTLPKTASDLERMGGGNDIHRLFSALGTSRRRLNFPTSAQTL